MAAGQRGEVRERDDGDHACEEGTQRKREVRFRDCCLRRLTLRTLENNKWIVRSTNDGFSAIIDNNGTIVTKIEKGDSSILNGSISLLKERSFYNIYGYLIPYLFALIVILFSVIQRVRNDVKLPKYFRRYLDPLSVMPLLFMFNFSNIIFVNVSIRF